MQTIYNRPAIARWVALFLASVCAWLGSVFVLSGAVVESAEITTFNQYYATSSEQAAKGIPVRLKGVVLSYDVGWNQFYIYDGTDTGWLSPQLFQTNLQAGLNVEITGNTTSGPGGTALTNLHLQVLAQGAMPDARPLAISQLGSGLGQWIQTTGRVRVAETSLGRLSLIVQDQGRTCLVYVMGLPATNDFKWLLGCNVRIRGINASKAVDGRLQAASIFASGLNEVSMLERSGNSIRRDTGHVH